MELHWIPAIVQTVAVLIWCGRGLALCYPAWTCYGFLASIQSLVFMVFAGNPQRSGAIWAVAAPVLLLGLLDAVLELFRRQSELYKRFRRDRWRWLVFPLLAGTLAGILLVSRHFSLPSDLYRALFLANTVVGTICGFVLLLSWIASVPVRIPINLRKHLFLLAIYVGSTTLAYANYFSRGNQQFIRETLVFMPPMVMLAWSLLLDPQEEREPEKTEEEMPESTLDQILGLLKRLS